MMVKAENRNKLAITWEVLFWMVEIEAGELREILQPEEKFQIAFELGWLENQSIEGEDYIRMTSKGFQTIADVLNAAGITPEEMKTISSSDLMDRLGILIEHWSLDQLLH